MYISKVFIKNYRSLKECIVSFDKGKNVIVGKNNSGKSNIIRAIEILIGERFPSYVKLSDNDFYTEESVDEETGEVIENISLNLFLQITIQGRDFDEDCIRSIKKKTAFSRVRGENSLYRRNEIEIEVNYNFFQNLYEIEQSKEIEVIDVFSSGKEKRTEWMTNEQLLTFLKTSNHFRLFFCKSREDDELSGFGIIVIDAEDKIWVSHFLSKKLRDSIITTTVISALRSPKEELRLVHYTWFGKLIENLWNNNKDQIDKDSERTYENLISGKTDEIKNLVDLVFLKNTQEIRSLLKRAIAHKSVSFKFLNDGKSELYKNVRIFVNDGIDRPLIEKGTGIQSAIIIALFSQYCNTFHNRSSLLIAEEPELFLHPQARRVISAELNNFLKKSETQERQLIISTHSIDYLKNVEPKNIIRVYKDSNENHSLVKQIKPKTSEVISNEIKRTIWSANAEIFFADKVILVEGGELYLLPSIIDTIEGNDQIIDYANYSIARVNGKGNFLTYIKILDELDINWVVLGDIDCYKDQVKKIISYLGEKELESGVNKIQEVISSNPPNYPKISDRIKNIQSNYDAQLLKRVFERFKDGTIEKEDEELNKVIQYMESRYAGTEIKEIIVDSMGNKEFEEFQSKLRDSNIFIWSEGELEDYYTDLAKSIQGSKDIKALEIGYKLKAGEPLNSYLKYEDEITKLIKIILKDYNRN